MKPPAASKFLQRGGLGEAHLDPPRCSLADCTPACGAGVLKPPHFLNKHLNPHHCDYTVFLLMRASAKAQVTLVTKLKGGHTGANSQIVVLLRRNH